MRVLTYALLAQLSVVDAQVAEIEKASNDSLLWGPYRPNLYFGVRPRIPKSLMGGLLWTKVEDHSVQHSEYSFFFFFFPTRHGSACRSLPSKAIALVTEL